MATLLVLRSAERMRDCIPLLKTTHSVGRDARSDLALAWDGISRRHASIVGSALDGSGVPTQWELVDEGGLANNGVFLNSERVTKVKLKNGDVIALGKGRDLPLGGRLSDKNTLYIFEVKMVRKDRAKEQASTGAPQQDLAGRGMHRQLRGAARHPLHGHQVVGEQKDRKDLRADEPKGENYVPCKSMVYPPSDWKPRSQDSEPPSSELRLEFVYGCRGYDLKDALHYLDADRFLYPAGSSVVIYDIPTHTQSFFQGHDDDVVSVAIHPSRRTVASGQVASSARKTAEGRPSAVVLVWELATLERNLSWPSRGVLARVHSHRIHAMSFNASGQYLVTYGGKEDASAVICVYDWRSGKIWWKLGAGAHTVLSVHHNPANPWQRSVLGTMHRVIYVMRVVRNQFVQCGDRSIRIWNYATAREDPEAAYNNAAFTKFTNKPTPANSVVFTEDGLGIIVAMGNGSIFIFGQKGVEITVLDQIKGAHSGSVLALLSCEEGIVSAGLDGFIRVWDVQWRGDRLSKPIELLKQVSLRPFAEKGFELSMAATNLAYLDGKLLVMTSINSILQVSLAELSITDHSHTHPAIATFARGHCGESRRDRFGMLLKMLAVNSVAAFPPPNEQLFCSVGDDRSLRIWNCANRNVHTLRNGKVAVAFMGMEGSCCSVSPDGGQIAVGHGGGQVTVWEAETLLCCLESSFRQRAVTITRFSPNGRLLLVGSEEGSIDVYDCRNGYRRVGSNDMRHSTTVTGLDISVDGQFVRSCDGTGEIVYWRLPLAAYQGRTIELRDTRWATQSCIFGWDKKAIWTPGLALNDVNAVAVSPSGRVIATAEDSGSTRLFRYPANASPQDAACKNYRGHSSAIPSLTFTCDDRYLLTTGGYDLCIFQWRHLRQPSRGETQAGGLGMRAD